MSPPLVEIRDLCVELGGVSILRGVNAALERGRITALIGLNGSGKTTLLRALLKEIPYAGQVRFHCGHDHRRQQPQHVGYVPQKLRMDANLPLTVRDLLALALQRRPLFLGISRAAEHAMVAILRRVSIPDPAAMLARPVDRLSGGELQRVLMGLALHPDPELLLLDEPAAGVDFKDQEKFYDLLSRLNAETGVTILLVSHDTSMVSRHAHHVLCLKDGRVACQGRPREVITDEMLAQIFGAQRGVYTHDHGDGSAA
jgi:zinc transport system ATP-binding protein